MPPLVDILLGVTFACGVAIAALHTANRAFVAPWYDVALNLTAFTCAATAAAAAHLWLTATAATLAILCWVGLAARTARNPPARRTGQTTHRRW